MMIQIFKNRHFSISLLEEGIYYASLAENENVSLKEVIRFNDAMDAIIQKEPHVVIVDITGALSVLAEGREYLVKNDREKTRTVIAGALITRTAMARTFGNFFVKVKPPKFPVKLFKDLETAEIWARTKFREYQDSVVKDDSESKDQP
jgi:hypothetical protein